MYLKKDRTIYLVAGITDMRKQINGLSAIAQDKQPEEVFSGSYFVFLGKTRKVMKILYWTKVVSACGSKDSKKKPFPGRENRRVL